MQQLPTAAAANGHVQQPDFSGSIVIIVVQV
jgi:hypothetical protein